MNKHTPGPWNRIKGDRNVYSAAGTVCKTPAILGGGSAATNWEANARLIAAAPELLGALIALYAVAEVVRDEDYGAVTNAAAVIAKATGEQA